MVKKPIKTNGFKGDDKLKNILPESDRSGSSFQRPVKIRKLQHEEVIQKVDDDFRLKKEIRKDESPLARSKLRRKHDHFEPIPQARSPSHFLLKLIVVIIGILILISSMVIAYQDRNEATAPDEDSIRADGHQFLEDLLICQEFSFSETPDRGIYSAYKVKYVTAEEIELSLEPEYNFYIEIIDTSDYYVKYSRTNGQGNAITNVDLDQVPFISRSNDEYPYNQYDNDDSEVFLINSFINIKVTDNEVHPATLFVMIWNKLSNLN
jgi:hypothetical protein